jgi:hypothetical protein
MELNVSFGLLSQLYPLSSASSLKTPIGRYPQRYFVVCCVLCVLVTVLPLLLLRVAQPPPRRSSSLVFVLLPLLRCRAPSLLLTTTTTTTTPSLWLLWYLRSSLSCKTTICCCFLFQATLHNLAWHQHLCYYDHRSTAYCSRLVSTPTSSSSSIFLIVARSSL